MSKVLSIGLVLVLIGLGLIVAGSVGGAGSVSTGGVVFIGPFPIVFGSGPQGSSLALISVAIGGVMVALMLLWWKRARSGPLD